MSTKKERSRRARGSREKGAEGERQAAEALREVYPLADRAPQQSRGARRDGPEIVGVPWWVEVKVGDKPPVYPAMRQAVRDARGGLAPMVMTRKTSRTERGNGWLVTFRWEDIAPYLAAWVAARVAVSEGSSACE